MDKGPSAEGNSTEVRVKMEHFYQAMDSLRPSVSDQDRQRYEHLRTVFDIS